MKKKSFFDYQILRETENNDFEHKFSFGNKEADAHTERIFLLDVEEAKNEN